MEIFFLKRFGNFFHLKIPVLIFFLGEFEVPVDRIEVLVVAIGVGCDQISVDGLVHVRPVKVVRIDLTLEGEPV